MEFRKQVFEALSGHGVMRQLFQTTGLNRAQIDETIGHMVKDSRSDDFHYPTHGINADRKF